MIETHSWNVSPSEARAIQEDLRGRVITQDDFGDIRQVAGTDVAFEEQGRVTRGAVALLEYPGLELIP